MKDDTPDYSRYTLEELHAIASTSPNTLFSRQYREVIKEIEKRERAMRPPVNLRFRNAIWKWVAFAVAMYIGIPILMTVITGIVMLYNRWQKPLWEVFTVTQSHDIKMGKKEMAKLRDNTQQFVVVEGPCNGGCQGGIIPGTAIKALIPEWRLVNSDVTPVVWLVQVRPKTIRRRTDAWNDDELIIRGAWGKTENVYFTTIPAKLVHRNLKWIKVEAYIE